MNERIYKTELHCHTKEMSPCSQESAEEVVKKYVDAGYTSLVVTNHFTADLCYWRVPGDTFREKVDSYFDAIDHVREAAGDSLNVIDGMEITFREFHNDYLVFGASRELFYDIENVFDMGYVEFFKYADEHGLLFVQAHPFRFGIVRTDPQYLHGIEVFNGHARHHSHNDIAELWVKHFNRKKLICTSGTDNHHTWQTPTGGILTDEPIRSNEQLLGILRSSEYDIIRTPLGDAEY